eukprot:CAMPEP_0172508106 /NCGR_PEP_ID=MMETSP1066-20121228/209216_1 /TAXON_ID=671091 /ORGANISM="Coscinodiscus wailesii, Strain CCMP2513" /LENGTH=262 /DNA_ID=CAMNT_0013285935 /DNA_START=102 /DNA_END=893 /DNA_ORIENTATION=+
MGPNKNDILAISLASFVAGVCVSKLIEKLKESAGIRTISHNQTIYRRDAGTTCEGNDLSLIYGDKTILTKTTSTQKFLPAAFYRQMVQDCVVTCVDILLLRYNPATSQHETLLVFRADEPVKGVWWWPGGRMFKGETFFACAMRKLEQETGITAEGDGARPVQVLGVWNTFFPTSAWDDERGRGTQTVNPIVLVVLPEMSGGGVQDVKLDKTSERHKWIKVDSRAAEKDGEIDYVLEGLRRLEAWKGTYGGTLDLDSVTSSF